MEIEYHLDRHIIKIDGSDYDARKLTLDEAKKLAEAKAAEAMEATK